MPTLKQLRCCLNWSGSEKALEEFNTQYQDGRVETYLAIADVPTSFSIQLRSSGYIAPGLAMFVYMDGQYQCNRNRLNLRIPTGTTSRRSTEINFQVRQKETLLPDGSMRGRQWRFQKLKTGMGDHTSSVAEYIGTIEVLVLRCSSICAIENGTLSSQGQPFPWILVKDDVQAERKYRKTKIATEQTAAQIRISKSGGDCLSGLSDGTNGNILINRGDMNGGDSYRDEQKSRSGAHAWGWEMTGARSGRFTPAGKSPWNKAEGDCTHLCGCSSSNSSSHYKQDWAASEGPQLDIEHRPAIAPRRSSTPSRNKRTKPDNASHNEDDGWTYHDNGNTGKENLASVLRTRFDRHSGLPRWESPYDTENTKSWVHDQVRAKAALGTNEAPGGEGARNFAAKLKHTKEDIHKVHRSGGIEFAENPKDHPMLVRHRQHESRQENGHFLAKNFQGKKPAVSQDFFSSPAPSHNRTTEHWQAASYMNGKVANQPAKSQDARLRSQQYLRTGKSYWNTRQEPLSGADSRHQITPYHTIDPSYSPRARLHTNPRELMDRETLAHRVNSGLSVPYAHKVATPQYMDTFEKPYAVFVFHYRSEEALERLLNIDVVAVEELGSERLKALSKEQLLDYFLWTGQNERTANRGVGEPRNSGPLQASRPAVAMKPTEDEDLHKKPEAKNAVEDETTDGQMNSDLNPNSNDRSRRIAPQPSHSKTSIPHRTAQVNPSGPTISMLDREWWDSGYQISHGDVHMNGEGVERGSNHNGKKEQANAGAKSRYAKSEQSRDNRMRLPKEQAEAGSSKSRHSQGVRSGINSGGWRPMSTSINGLTAVKGHNNELHDSW